MPQESKDLFGDRMKGYEQREAGRRSMDSLPLCIRLDGICFSKLTKKLSRPVSEEMHSVMCDITKALVKRSGAVIGYTQSDEISLILYTPKQGSQLYFNGKYQKLCSSLASLAGGLFERYKNRIPNLTMTEDPATFDCRAWEVPNIVEAINTLVWRELDCTKNSVSMLSRCFFSHKQLDHKGRADMMDMLHSKGINWARYSPAFKRGSYIVRVRRRLSINDVLNKLQNVDSDTRAKISQEILKNGSPERTSLEICNLPPISKIENRYDILLRTINLQEYKELCSLADLYDTGEKEDVK